MIDRRKLLAGGAAGLLWPASALAQRRRAAAPAEATAAFTHGVATGEPGPTSMLFWTRYVGERDAPTLLRLEVASDPRMARARVLAEALAEPGRDWTARATVEGLSPGRTYYYRWIGPGRNDRSMVGRTMTLPEGAVTQYRLGVFSCSNLPFGFFNAYAHAVAADDIDLFVHLGDYIYEYARGTYPGPDQAVAGRLIEPPGELVRREEYWARYRSYRADPDLQALHARVPSITVWDDHEIANDAWTGGAENHDTATQGPWNARLEAAKAAYRDWMPISDRDWARYDIGRLATIFRLDTRVAGRDRQLDVTAAIARGPDTMTALKRLRDEEWAAGGRQLLGQTQEQWLLREMRAARSLGARWQVLAQQVVMGTLKAPAGAAALAGPDADPRVAGFLGAAELLQRMGMGFNMDAWDGYPAARARLLGEAQRLGVDLVVLAGDSHNGWAFDLAHDGRPAGVEFATPSVTSPGFEAYLGTASPTVVAGALRAANPGLRWADLSRRGYVHLTLSPSAARGAWRFTAPVGSRATALAGTEVFSVAPGQRRLTPG